MEFAKYIKVKNRLFEYVKHRSKQGHFPTVRYLARRYKTRQETIMNMLDDLTDHLIDINVGFRTHSGVGSYDNIGDYTAEYYGYD